jgi:hypothetical protein
MGERIFAMTQITAYFDSRDLADAALGKLRHSGTAYSLSRISGHGGDADLKTLAGSALPGGATLQVRVTGADAAAARELIRHAGGREVGGPALYF